MNSHAEALLDSREPHSDASVEALPGGADRRGARMVPRRIPASGRSDSPDVTLPILALRPVGEGVVLARALARVLVRRALAEEGAIDVVDHCTDERAEEESSPTDGGAHRIAESI